MLPSIRPDKLKQMMRKMILAGEYFKGDICAGKVNFLGLLGYPAPLKLPIYIENLYIRAF
jgi:hypothetical protein